MTVLPNPVYCICQHELGRSVLTREEEIHSMRKKLERKSSRIELVRKGRSREGKSVRQA